METEGKGWLGGFGVVGVHLCLEIGLDLRNLCNWSGKSTVVKLLKST